MKHFRSGAPGRASPEGGFLKLRRGPWGRERRDGEEVGAPCSLNIHSVSCECTGRNYQRNLPQKRFTSHRPSQRIETIRSQTGRIAICPRFGPLFFFFKGQSHWHNVSSANEMQVLWMRCLVQNKTPGQGQWKITRTKQKKPTKLIQQSGLRQCRLRPVK